MAIVQSNYIPWKGYYDMIAAVDEFQNIDTDYSSGISLSSESGDLSQTGLVGNLEDGV